MVSFFIRFERLRKNVSEICHKHRRREKHQKKRTKASFHSNTLNKHGDAENGKKHIIGE
jgi:hypothetical protein